MCSGRRARESAVLSREPRRMPRTDGTADLLSVSVPDDAQQYQASPNQQSGCGFRNLGRVIKLGYEPSAYGFETDERLSGGADRVYVMRRVYC